MNPSIRTLIIEDEVDAQNLLSKIVREYCPDLEMVGIADSLSSAKKMITTKMPDLVFLDIELKDGNAFMLLEDIKQRNFKIIFTTAYEEFALKAFRYEAIDYIMKPYSPKDVITAVSRVKKKKYDETIYNRLDFLVKQSTRNQPQKISIPSSEGVTILNVSDVIRIEADRAYCYIYTSDSMKTMVSKPLKEIEESLPPDLFFRSHSGHLINMEYVSKYISEDGGYILMTDGTQVPLARRRKGEFIEVIG